MRIYPSKTILVKYLFNVFRYASLHVEGNNMHKSDTYRDIMATNTANV